MQHVSDRNGRFRWILPTTALALLLLAAAYFWRERSFAALNQSALAPNNVVEQSLRSTTKKPGAAAPSPPNFPVAYDGTVAIPTKFQLPGVGRAKSGVNSKEWLAQYPPDQQGKIRAFDKRHFGVYSVNSQQQVAWMAENGYPMPEDVIAAEKLSDADLREMAKQGNDKAGFLLRERNVAATKERLDAYHALGKTTSDFWSNDPDARQLRMDDASTTQLLQQSHSPFKGYVQAFGAAIEDDQMARDSGTAVGCICENRSCSPGNGHGGACGGDKCGGRFDTHESDRLPERRRAGRHVHSE
jgi:hypothetical protein